MRLFKRFATLIAMFTAVLMADTAMAQKKPNILVIMGDDLGIPNISVYSHGMMGYKTPNIDRIAKEGVLMTDYYAEQSCTAGRASFITGQYGIRTGLTNVGLPGAPIGIQDEDPTACCSTTTTWASCSTSSRS